MKDSHIKRRRIAGKRGVPSAFTPGSSQRAPSRPIAPPAQTSGQAGPSRHSRADSIESDAEDDYQHVAVELPDQLPSLPEGHEGDVSAEARDTEETSPKPLSRSERLREILKFRGLAERYGETEGREGKQYPSQLDLRLSQAIHAYAVEYYASKAMLIEDKVKGEKDAPLRTRSSKARGGHGTIDRGRDIIPPHLIKKPARKVYAATLGQFESTVPYDVLSDLADSDYVASDNEEEDDDEIEREAETSEPARQIHRGTKTAVNDRGILENVQDAFDETALFAICEYRLRHHSERKTRLTVESAPSIGACSRLRGGDCTFPAWRSR
ncbi:hypothetical protein BCV69DRAFT_283136 [Microstroma glucosiphilum]|uniref:Uncharacterized protein n=1 Tax=Pseudomicrostroma glucosiphilum TaxID=1684307 RepID=A0A316U4U9_9BASI|nr:hypothetical protein BCV69DRAFT_283136 [Pseudomicrostroma glucosiphilum]PWN20259.1 hypothetical protein BCV69DRAFT_283136 [Pseudomicrostroma glucosiphilum]